MFEKLINSIVGERRLNYLKDFVKQNPDLAELALDMYYGCDFNYQRYLGSTGGNVDSWMDYKAWLLNWVSRDCVKHSLSEHEPKRVIFNKQNQLCEFFIEWRCLNSLLTGYLQFFDLVLMKRKPEV